MLWAVSLHLYSLTHVALQGIYDTAWYPWMHASVPATNCFLVTGKAMPVHLRDGTTGAARASYVGYDQNDEPESALCVTWSRDGARLYGACEGVVRVWDAQMPGRPLSTWDVQRSKVDGEPVTPHRPVRGLISCLQWSPDGAMLAAGSYAGNVAIFNNVGECVLALKKAQPRGVTQVRWSHDSTIVYVGGRKSTAIVAYDVRLVARNPKGAVPLLSFARDTANTHQHFAFDVVGSTHLLSGHSGSGTVTVYDAVNGSVQSEMALHSDVVGSVHMHPALPLLLTGTGQRRLPLAERGENVVSIWSLRHSWSVAAQ